MSESRNIQIIHYVGDLARHSTPHSNLRRFILAEEGNADSPDYLLPSLLAKLEGFPKLELFKFQGGYYTEQHKVDASKGLANARKHACSSLHTVTVEGVSFNAFDFRFLQNFAPNIKALSVDLVQENTEEVAKALEECSRNLPAIRELSLLTFMATEWFRFRFDTSLLSNLTRLRTNARIIAAEQLRDFPRLTILSYELTGGGKSIKSFAKFLLDPTYLPSLQILRIGGITSDDKRYSRVLKEVEETRKIKAVLDDSSEPAGNPDDEKWATSFPDYFE